MKKYLVACIGLALFSACNRDTENRGPNAADLFGDLNILEGLSISDSVVDFSTGESLTFDARFNLNPNWELEIIGLNSGAKKVITGQSRTLADNGAVWDGTTTNLPLFKEEPCIAVLKTPDSETIANDTLRGFRIAGTRIYEGFVMADFESGVNPGWTIFAQSGGNMSFNVVQDPKSPQGNAFYDMGGEVDFDFLIGLIDMPASAYNETTFPLNNNGDNVYFNVFLDKPDSINNEIILFRFMEDENGDGVFTEATEDMYAIELRNIESEWSLISSRYSDLQALVNGQPASPNGNGLHEPDKLIQVSVLFLADPSSGYSQTLMDYMIFTENGPLEP